TDRQFEVIVADDGSEPSLADVVERWKPRMGVALGHVWHEHRDFWAPEIANRAVLASSGSYCIFLDGDCIPRPSFVAVHRGLPERGCFVFGSRVLLSPEMAERVLRAGLQPETWRFRDFAVQRVRGAVNRLAPLVPLPLGPLRKRGARDWRSVRTCNLAVWRSDLDRVDGQDGRYCGWGPHDSDRAVRLIRSGISRKDGRFATGVLHLWHPPAARSRLELNQQIFDEVLRSDRVLAVRGFSALRAEAPTSRTAAVHAAAN